MASTRRLVLLGGIAALSLFAVPAAANAVVYCVPNDAIDVSCTTGQGQATIQAAFNAAAASTAVADTVRIDAGSYSEANLDYSNTNSGNVLNVIGEGPAQTLLTIPNTTGNVTGLSISAPTGSSVSNLAMTIPANADANGDTGIFLGGDVVFGHNLLIDGASATNATGIRLSAGSGLDTSTVNLPFASPTNQAVYTGSSDGASIADSVLHADTGVHHGGSISQTATVDRSTIQASTAGVTEDSGTVNVRNSLIDLGTSLGAVGVQAANFNNGVTAMAANLNGDTIVGGGSGSTGVQAQADSAVGSNPNDNFHDGEDSTVTVANTILSGQTNSLRVEADRGETAAMTTSYSNYDTSTKVVTSNLTPGGGTGTANFSESHQTNLSPGFVSSSDFHLASTSALIDAGDPAGPPFGAEDIDGDNREILGKDGCAPRRDIGADEFVPGSPPTLLDCTPPDTSFQSGPAGTIADNTPTFTFASTESPSTFQCSVDGGSTLACTTPFTSVPLPDGAHTLAVQAIDSSSNVDPTPATRSFTVDTTAPDTTLGSHPKPKTKSRKATFTFSASEAGSSFLCSFDGKPYAACSGSFTTPKLTRGRHRFDVLATDAVGNRDQSAATFLWKVTKRHKH
jgi:hypothetical protein